jgi:hypothetical protein
MSALGAVAMTLNHQILAVPMLGHDSEFQFHAVPQLLNRLADLSVTIQSQPIVLMSALERRGYDPKPPDPRSAAVIKSACRFVRHNTISTDCVDVGIGRRGYDSKPPDPRSADAGA